MWRALTLAVLIGPVAAGLGGTLALAFGLVPGWGTPGLGAWAALLAQPGLATSVLLSLWCGVVSTLLALGLTLLILAAGAGTRALAWVERALAPLLAIPHAAAALGLAFLVAPSGWIARALSPWATGWDRPPDLMTLGDPWGLSLIAGLVVKETPFLLLLGLAALAQARARRRAMVAAGLGYGPVTGWVKAVWPGVYAQIRLGVLAVLAYGTAVVDVAILLGPGTPAPLAVRVTTWMRDPDPGLWAVAAAGAVVQAGVVLAALALWRAAERAAAALAPRWQAAGGRGRADRLWQGAAVASGGLAGGALALGLAALALWSVAGPWPFPDALPAALTLRVWAAGDLGGPLGTTLGLAAAATGLALALAIGGLEAERRFGRAAADPWVLYLPLLVPQVAFLFGLQLWTLLLGVDRGWGAVVWAHLVFVLPYVLLSLGPPWRALDRRADLVAAALGAGPWRALVAVRLPMLLRPILAAAAVGVAVSAGQFLPTLLVGGGRLTTLATETVALAAGADRRVVGMVALVQALVPLGAFALALALPRLIQRRGGTG